jgi:hypothetical protein
MVAASPGNNIAGSVLEAYFTTLLACLDGTLVVLRSARPHGAPVVTQR